MKRYSELDRLLQFMEDNIDLEHIDKIEQLHYDTINLKEVPHLPLSLRTTPDGFDQIPLEDAFNNPEYMLFNEILWSTVHSSYNSVRLKDENPLMIRSNHGIGIIATMFGCKSSVFNNEMPWVEHIEWDEAYKALSKGVPDFHSGLGNEVFNTYEYYHERLREYPKCYKAIHFEQPDLQGPYDILHHIIGNEAFFAVYDRVKEVKEMLQVITDTYIGFRKELQPLLTDQRPEGDAVFVHGYLVQGQVVLKCDTAFANLSPDMCEEFELSYVKQVNDAFSDGGYGTVHSCGLIRPATLERALDVCNMRGFNFGNPDMHNLKEVHDVICGRGKAIIGWGYNMNYDDEYIKALEGIKTGVTTYAVAKSPEHAKEILSTLQW